MKMSPAQTLSAIDRVKRSFQVEEGPMRDLRALIRETLLLESEMATKKTQGTSATDPAVTGQEEQEKKEKVTKNSETIKSALDTFGKSSSGKKIATIAKNTASNKPERRNFIQNILTGTVVSDKTNAGDVLSDLRDVAGKISKDIRDKKEAEKEELKSPENVKDTGPEKTEQDYQVKKYAGNLPK
jgi:hypothetical protein